MTDGHDRPSETEPRGTKTDAGGEKKEPVREYPDEGVRSHYPTDPATAKTPASPQADGTPGDDSTAA